MFRGAKKRTFRFGKKNVSFPKVETFRFADYTKLVILEVIDASYTCEDLDFPVCIRLNPQDVESMFPMSKISSYLTYKYPKNKRTKRLYVIEKR